MVILSYLCVTHFKEPECIQCYPRQFIQVLQFGKYAKQYLNQSVQQKGSQFSEIQLD